MEIKKGPSSNFRDSFHQLRRLGYLINSEKQLQHNNEA